MGSATRKGGGFGFVILLVVLAAVLLLTARAWERSGATAVELDADPAGPASQREAAGEALSELPNLQEMRDATSQHAGDVEDALAAIDE